MLRDTKAGGVHLLQVNRVASLEEWIEQSHDSISIAERQESLHILEHHKLGENLRC
jgi:hypothetical protein